MVGKSFRLVKGSVAMQTDGPPPRKRERPREAEEALRAVGEAIEKARRRKQQEQQQQDDKGLDPQE